MTKMLRGRREKTEKSRTIFRFKCRAEVRALAVAVRNEATFVGFLNKRRITKYFRLRRGGHFEGAVRRVRGKLLLREAVNDAGRSFCMVANWTGDCVLVWRRPGSRPDRLAKGPARQFVHALRWHMTTRLEFSFLLEDERGLDLYCASSLAAGMFA